MNISILIDNVAGDRCLAEHGLSYLIRHDGQNILFDTGHSDAFLKNAETMGIDLEQDVSVIVLSHGHWDHGDGLRFIKDKKLITHPSVFLKRYRQRDHSYIGLALNKDEMASRFQLITSEKPYFITENIIFLGSIPRKNNYEAQSTTFIDEKGEKDFVPDDSAMVIIHNNEIFLISGCAHAGICNTIEYAKEVVGISKVNLVLGGFHLKYDDYQTKQTIQYIKGQKIKSIYPSHCTELPALKAFAKEFDITQVKTGMIFNF